MFGYGQVRWRVRVMRRVAGWRGLVVAGWRGLIVAGWIGLAGGVFAVRAESAAARPNVLFIVLDDLNDWTGCLGGHPDVRTPNMDRLANRGMLFTEAYCVSPLCNPSRSAVFTGRRPETTGVYHNVGNYTDQVPEAVPISKHFMEHGYRALGAGKLIHPSGNVVPTAFDAYGPGIGCVGGPFTAEEMAMGNMRPTHTVDRGPGGLRVVLPLAGLSTIDCSANQYSTFDWGPVDVSDDEMADGQVARWAVERIREGCAEPFFLGVGFFRPHQPLFAPRKYFEYYPPTKISLPVTSAGDVDDLPDAGRDLALLPWASGRHRTVVSHNQWREAVAGYLAAVTFADAQVGRVLDALDESGYAENTLIVLWGDNGWHLGEKEHWGKHTPWRRSTHVPLIIVPPKKGGVAGFRAGQRCDVPVSLLDLYPTLIEMCGLRPRGELEGRSLVPLLKDPAAAWEGVVVSTVGRGSHSVCTRRWLYVRYFDGSEELYDRQVDAHEWFNLGNDAKYAEVRKELAGHIPVDKRFRQFVRWGRWKAVIQSDGEVMLFDILAAHGISEQVDVAEQNPKIVERILGYLKTKNISERYVKMPEEEARP